MDYKILNKNAMKIIDCLKNSEKMYFNEIYEKTCIKSRNNLLKNLNLMVNLRLLKKEENKSNTFFRINYENYVSIKLISLSNSMNFYNLPFNRIKIVEELIKNLKPTLAVIFGSTAKGNYNKDSDIDILMIYNEKKTELLEEIKNISSRYGLKVNAIISTFKEIEKKTDALIHVIKTGYTIVGEEYFYELKIWLGNLDWRRK